MKRIVFLGVLVTAAIATRAEAANPDHVQRLLKTNQCPNCDLSGADLKDTNLFGTNLVNANLKGANFAGANLGSANLSDADATGANFNKTYLDRATLENTNLTEADLSESYLKNAVTIGTQFSKAKLRGAKLGRINLSGANLKGVDLSDTDLSGAILSGFRTTGMMPMSSLMGMDTSMLASMVCRDPSSFPDTDLKFMEDLQRYGLEFSTADLGGANLKGANLRNTVMLKTDLTGANLTGANLTGACLVSANLTNAILDEANLQNAQMKNARLMGASLKGTRNANLKDAFETETEVKVAEHEPQARSLVSAMMRGQQAYLLEQNQFALKPSDLRISEVQDSEHYAYRIFAPGKRSEMIVVAAVPKMEGMKTFLGFVSVLRRKGQEGQTVTRLCESQEAKPVLPKFPTTAPANQAIACPAGFTMSSR